MAEQPLPGEHSARLLGWYEESKRDLPWRRTSDPYRIWVSEVMLQQTRVAYARDYYERFIAALPSVDALAAASESEVLALWSGLGYYRRARQMHAAARQIIATGGDFPETVEGLLELPGVGPYTAAAVASIAMGLPEQVLDGNVERVLTRFGASEASLRTATGRRELLATGRVLFDPVRPGDSNQALMELGAMVCLPRAPHCRSCPLVEACQASVAGRIAEFPRPRSRRAPQRERRLAARVVRGDRVLLVRRPADSDLLPGTWELPWVVAATTGVAGPSAAVDFEERYGGLWNLGAAFGEVKHAITYRALTVEVVAAEVSGSGDVAEGIEAGWFTGDEIEKLPHSSLTIKALELATVSEKR